MSDEFSNERIEAEKRPGFLKAISIMSFVGIGLRLILNFAGLFSTKRTEEQMLAAKYEMSEIINDFQEAGMDSFVHFMRQSQEITEITNEHLLLANGLAIIIGLIGLLGVIKMWNGFKVGFHIYIIYSLFYVGAIYLYVSPVNIPSIMIIFGSVISLIFILMYSRNLHWMKK